MWKALLITAVLCFGVYTGLRALSYSQLYLVDARFDRGAFIVPTEPKRYGSYEQEWHFTYFLHHAAREGSLIVFDRRRAPMPGSVVRLLADDRYHLMLPGFWDYWVDPVPLTLLGLLCIAITGIRNVLVQHIADQEGRDAG